jgi:hypothetical protein
VTRTASTFGVIIRVPTYVVCVSYTRSAKGETMVRGATLNKN